MDTEMQCLFSWSSCEVNHSDFRRSASKVITRCDQCCEGSDQGAVAEIKVRVGGGVDSFS